MPMAYAGSGSIRLLASIGTKPSWNEGGRWPVALR